MKTVLDSFDLQLNELRLSRKKQVSAELTHVQSKINQRGFVINLRQHAKPAGAPSSWKPIYSPVNDAPESYYALKKVSNNLRSIYQYKPAERNEIVSRIINLLGDKFPYQLVRTDIESFYESIDQKELIAKIEKDRLISKSSILLIKQVIYDYNQLTGGTQNKGLPRGISISADLAEVYLKQVDLKVKEIPQVVYYSRYVDDMFEVVL